MHWGLVWHSLYYVLIQFLPDEEGDSEQNIISMQAILILDVYWLLFCCGDKIPWQRRQILEGMLENIVKDCRVEQNAGDSHLEPQ